MGKSERNAMEKDFSGYLREKETSFKKSKHFTDKDYKKMYCETRERAAPLERKNHGLPLAIIRERAVGNAGFHALELAIVGAGLSALALIMDAVKSLVEFLYGNGKEISMRFSAVVSILTILCLIAALILFCVAIYNQVRARSAAFYAFAETAIENMGKEQQKNKQEEQK